MSREALITTFLTDAGWGKATRKVVPGDASTRRYERLTLKTHTAILMDAPQNSEAPIAPPDATNAERMALGYNALARLAGNNVTAFATISNELSMRGFSAPKILAADLDRGLLLLEDLGGDMLARVISADAGLETELYTAAVDTLAAIYRSSFQQQFSYVSASGTTVHWQVKDYDTLALLGEGDLCLDWYAKDLGYDIAADAREEWTVLWSQAFETLQAHAPGLCLRDYHAENLFWLPERQATARTGLIDFQDALFVHPAYDLASFLEDARRDVTPDLFEPLKQRFCEKSGIKYDSDFKAAYAVMAAQRNTKVIGFPVRADLKFGKPQYRALIPRVRAHLQRDLSHPALTKIRSWYQTHIPEILHP